MTTRWLHLGMVVALCCGVPAVVLGQQATPPKPEATPAPAPEGEGNPLLGDEVDVSGIDEILRGEQDLLKGGIITYNPADRRDPFRSLKDFGLETEEEKPRPPGLAGMLVEELTVEGIIETPAGILAFVQGRDRTSYIIRPGTKLYNGEVVDIQQKRVIFRQQTDDPKQINPYQEVVRVLSD